MCRLSSLRISGCLVVTGAALLLTQCAVARAEWTDALAGQGFVSAQFMPGGAVSHGAQGYLGIDVQDVSDDRIGVLKLKESRGAEVIHVDHDAPAGHMGLREHDVILQMNGQVIEGEEQLRRILRETPPGRQVTLLISRDGVQQTLASQMATREEVERQALKQRFIVPDPETNMDGQGPGPALRGGEYFSPAPATPPTVKSHSFIGSLTLGSSYTGVMVETMGPQLAQFFGTAGVGVLVHSVDANSPAAAAGLHAGDVVVRANDRKMMSQSDWTKVVRENKGKPISMVVLRDKKEQTLTLIPDAKKRSSVEEPGQERPVVAWLGRSFRVPHL